MSRHPDPFTGVTAFVLAAELRSLTAAAQRIGLTPSAVSKAISRLESAVGVRLLNRSPRAVSLTPDGTEFFHRCRQIVGDMEGARQALVQKRSTPQGLLRVSLPLSYGRVVVLPQLPALLDRHPGLQIEAELTNRHVDLIEEGFDVVVRMGAIRDENLIARRLGPIRYRSAASSDYLARYGIPRSPAELSQHHCVAMMPGSTRTRSSWSFATRNGTRRQEVDARLVVSSAEAMVEAAIAGGGVVQTFDFLLHGPIERGSLTPILGEFDADGPAVHVAFAQRRLLSPKIRVFVDHLVQALGS